MNWKEQHIGRVRSPEWPNEPWSKTGYACVPSPGMLTHFGAALREPCGRVHWAGKETSERWCGYVDVGRCGRGIGWRGRCWRP